MKLAANWRAVLRRAWSVRLMVVAAVLSGVEVALPLLHGVIGIPAGLFAGASGFCTAAAFAARLVAQRNLPEGRQE